MADSTLAQSGAVRKPFAQLRASENKLIKGSLNELRFIRRWVRFLLLGQRLSMQQLVDFVRYNKYFWAMQVPSELTALGELLVNLQPERALEIGTAHGGTLLFLTRLASPRATIVSADLPEGKFGGGYSLKRQKYYQRFARRRQRLHLLRGDSHSEHMLAQVKAAFGGEPLDYLFIDGDHRYEGVKSDFEMYGPLVRKGGLVAFHDIVDGHEQDVGGVPRFWREIKLQYRHSEFVENWRQRGWGIGVLYVD